jgi:hypothetical protein
MPKSRLTQGLKPHFKVRIGFHGFFLHLASWTEPVRRGGQFHADWITDPNYGDTVGFIDWQQVIAVTWRHTSEPGE